MTKVKALFRYTSILLCLLVAMVGSATAGDSGGTIQLPVSPANTQEGNLRDAQTHQYKGYLRLYVVEPTSRYTDADGANYDFGFLGFAYNQMITLNYRDTIHETVSWSGTGLAQGNIQVIAVLFNSDDHPAYAYPPGPWNPFMAHWVDAVAVGESGSGCHGHCFGRVHTYCLSRRSYRPYLNVLSGNAVCIASNLVNGYIPISLRGLESSTSFRKHTTTRRRHTTTGARRRHSLMAGIRFNRAVIRHCPITHPRSIPARFVQRKMYSCKCR